MKKVQSKQNAKTFNSPQQLAFGSNGQRYSRGGVDDYQLLWEYANNGIVRSCADLNAKGVASLPIHLYTQRTNSTQTKSERYGKVPVTEVKRLKRLHRIAKSATVEEVLDSPLLELLTDVNPTLNGYQLWMLTSLYLDVLGRAYWYLDEYVGDVPTSIQILLPQKTQPVRDKDGVLTGYRYGRGIGAKDLRVEDVIDFRLPSLTDPYCGGISPLASVYSDVLLVSQFSEYMNTLLQNRARPDAILSPKNDVGEDESDRLRKKYENRFSGAGNGGIMVSDSSLDLKLLSYSPTDLAPLAFAGAAGVRVMNAFGIPEGMLSKDANRASAETALYQHAKLSLAPRAALISQRLNETLVPLFGDNLFLSFDEVVPEDRDYQLRAIEALLPYDAVTKNEGRAAADLPPTPDGDGEYLGNTSAADVVGVPPEAEDEPETEDPADEDADDADESGKTFNVDTLIKLNTEVATGNLPRSTAINIAEAAGFVNAKNLIGFKVEAPVQKCTCGEKQAHPSKVEGPWRKIIPQLQKVFNAQRKEVLGRIEKGIELQGITTKALPEEFVSLEDWDNQLDHAVKPVVEIMAQEAGQQTLKRVGASPDVFAVAPAKITEAVDKASLKFAQSTNNSTTQQLNDALQAVRDELKDGLLEGDGIPELTKRINEIFDQATQDRAEMIAQTEASRAVHTGQQIAAQESGLVKGFKFLKSDDACAVCDAVAAEQPEIGLDGKFGTSEYDDSPLPVHPNCRCSMLEILDDGKPAEEQQAEADNGE